VSDPADLNPQAEQMADESMVRTLAAQAEAIWPQERRLFERYALPDEPRILDAGCGTGECSRRLAELFPQGRLLGVDILDAHLERARQLNEGLGARVSFENRSLFGLGLPDASFDLTVCRHVIHSIPRVEDVVRELARVTRPGGWLHLIAEDYGMLHFSRGAVEPDDFWREGPRAFGAATGTDLHIGRQAFSLLRDAGLRDVSVDYVIVDTQRVPRETFAAIMEAWREGYVEPAVRHTRFSREEVEAFFDETIAAIRDPERYGVWFVPVVAGQVPA
jgi:ubiquinone/menaquinone biosynthesis C-methylase UbiE